MIKKLCTYCGNVCWHNEMKKSGEYRCTQCGTPPSTNPAKREYQETLRRKLSKRLA